MAKEFEEAPVNCCFNTRSTIYLYEVANDQDAVPGYRYIRTDIQGIDGLIRTVRIKFCPFCGQEFKGAGIRE